MKIIKVKSNIGFLLGRYLRDPLNEAFRALWRRTLTNQGVFDDGLRFKYGRWNIRYHSFADSQQSGFAARGEATTSESLLVDGWMFVYSDCISEPLTAQENSTKQQRDEGGGKFVNLPGFPVRYGGLWVATNPWRDRVCVCGVDKCVKPVMRLRELAAHLARGGKKKCRGVGWRYSQLAGRRASGHGVDFVRGGAYHTGRIRSDARSRKVAQVSWRASVPTSAED